MFECSVCDESAWFSESDEFLIFVKFIVLLDKEVLWESRGLCIRLGLVVLYKLPDINGLSISLSRNEIMTSSPTLGNAKKPLLLLAIG